MKAVVKMINKIGLRAHDYGRQELSQLLSSINADGWQSIQLAFAKAAADVNSTKDITQKHFDVLKSSPVTVSVLGSYVDLGLVDEKLRKAEAAKFIANISIAKAVNAGCIGSETTPIAAQPMADKKDAVKALYKSLCEILPVAQELGVTVGIEPVYWHTLSTPALTKQMLLDLQSQNLKIIFDPINLLSASCLKTQHTLWEQCFEAFGDKIAAIHVKGVKFEGEKQVNCSLSQSQADTKYLLTNLQKLPCKFDVLREEAEKGSAKEDIAFIKQFI